ncbi:amino acid adenylation domain-containing protein [Amycolatopsis sp. NPDC059090]|uniref:amino acid adenylation domain-containing protein n=1 Tax=Amycolatopsis sp. NPDC059090 TaxID=3346723 RepID=UPI00366ADF11
MRLEELALDCAARTPQALAICGPDGRLTYRELDELAARLASDLAGLGVREGDRVALWLSKSAFAVAAMQAVLRLGAAYVPLDPLVPARRAAALIVDCSPAAVVTTAERLPGLSADRLGFDPPIDPGALPAVLVEEGATSYRVRGPAAPAVEHGSDRASSGPDIAYVLYTSGSTGRPKGVCVSHSAALAFVGWAADELRITPDDRLANHAPLQFDLSVFDIYAAFRAGASVHLIPEATPARGLPRFLLRHAVSVWYSVPSVLTLMLEHGSLLDVEQLPLRVVVFAGEVFPIKYLKKLRDRWPRLDLYNFYGPTETNVCTYHRVGVIPADRTEPVPIGRSACADEVWAVRPDGSVADVGEEGELLVKGPTVMSGYLGDPEPQNGPYFTGDIVRRIDECEFEYVGRRDHMVKIRGHRVELGEIESVLHQHPEIVEAAVLAVGEGHSATLCAWIATRSDGGPSLLEVKRFLADRVPRYMIVDSVRRIERMPRTSNGKTDRARLLAD